MATVPIPVYSDPQVADLLAELNASVPARMSLRTWAVQSATPTTRIVERPNLTYVRLAVHDERREPVVLMLLEGVWERAM